MGTGTDKAFRDPLAQFSMNFSGSIDRSRAGQEGDVYVNYPIGIDQRAFLQFHAVWGNSREDRYCMRIYFSGTRTPIKSWSGGSHPTSETGSRKQCPMVMFDVSGCIKT